MIFPRTTLTMASRQSLSNLENIRVRRQRATNEISTGLRVRKASDSPIEAGGIVRTQSALEGLAQFRSSLQAVGDQLRAADTALNHAVDLVIRANNLASQAANFSQTAETRAGIGTEIEGIVQNLITIANTEFGGKFLFSGLAEDTRPFVADATSPDGVVYRGDTGHRAAALPGGTEIQSSLDGRSIFLLPDVVLGSGRTAGTTGATTPDPPVGVGIAFTGGLNAALYADLASFFVASAPPTVPSAGDQITVTFTATDSSFGAGVTVTLAGGESTAQIAAALNAQVAATPQLAGKVTFLDQGGNLTIVESDTVGVGLNLTASATGGLVTGLEPGGTVGGLSAQEIAAALNAQVAVDPALSFARVVFTAVNGEVQVESDVATSFTVVDFPRGTGFVSGLAGEHGIGGVNSANVFRVLKDLHTALAANDVDGIKATLDGLGRAVAHLSTSQGFYGSTGRQVLSALDVVNQFELVDREKLASLREADLPRSISNLTQAQVNEEATLRVMASQSGPNLFDFLA
jgi:flagellin-like hook-associated protein FlgL